MIVQSFWGSTMQSGDQTTVGETHWREGFSHYFHITKVFYVYYGHFFSYQNLLKMKFISKRSSKNTSFDRVSVRLKIAKPTSGMLHPGGGGGWMLVISPRGVNFGFWSHLGCSGQNAITFSRKGLFQGCTRSNIDKLFVCVLKWSFLGVKKWLGHAQFGLLYVGA